MRGLALACAALVAALLQSAVAGAQIQRDPNGVNVSTTRQTSLTIRFREIDGDQFTTTEALFCFDLLANGACRPGTILGRLPVSADRGSTTAPTGALTDFMTIPFQVVRAAVERARGGAFSDFFYVRRFTPIGGADIGAGPGQDVFVFVTCRLTGGSARTPLSLSTVQLYGEETSESGAAEGARLIRLNERNIDGGVVRARIVHTGTGRISGWWEVRGPGDPPLRPIDLFTEASLPEDQRGQQQRFTRVKRIDQQVFGDGEVILTGPRYSELPRSASGRYEVLLRLEASVDRETLSRLDIPGQSQALFSGAVAGFALRPLEYLVPAGLGGAKAPPDSLGLRLLRREDSDGEAWVVGWSPPAQPGLVLELSRATGPGADLERLIAPAELGAATLPSAWTEGAAPQGLTARLLGPDAAALSDAVALSVEDDPPAEPSDRLLLLPER